MLWDLTVAQFIITGSFICCTSFICGWFADKIIDRTGFGAIGNWLLLLIGAYVGMFVYNHQGYTLGADFNFTVMLAGGSALAMLIVMMTIKKFTRS